MVLKLSSDLSFSQSSLDFSLVPALPQPTFERGLMLPRRTNRRQIIDIGMQQVL